MRCESAVHVVTSEDLWPSACAMRRHSQPMEQLLLFIVILAGASVIRIKYYIHLVPLATTVCLQQNLYVLHTASGQFAKFLLAGAAINEYYVGNHLLPGVLKTFTSTTFVIQM
jgi:hypothetical protein